MGDAADELFWSKENDSPEVECGTCDDRGWYQLGTGRCLCGCEAGERYRAKFPDNSPHKNLPAHLPVTI